MKDWLFKTKEGGYVYGQEPNAPMVVSIIALLIKIFLNEDSIIFNIVETIQYGSLVYWALLEIFSGANRFRKILGFVVVLFIISIIIQKYT